MNKYNLSFEFATDKDALRVIDKLRPYIMSAFNELGVERSVQKLELLESEETEVQE